MERFFSLSHLTQDQLRDLYLDACKVGSRVINYAKQTEQEYYEISLPDEVVLKNIRVGNHSYAVFRRSFDGMPDATTVAFPLAEHPYVTVYIDIDNSLFDRFAAKYGLNEWWQMEGGKRRDYPLSEFYRTMTMIPGRPAVN
jgi:hypothetical protein